MDECIVVIKHIVQEFFINLHTIGVKFIVDVLVEGLCGKLDYIPLFQVFDFKILFGMPQNF